MLKFLLLTIFALATNAEKLDPISDQIAIYNQTAKGSCGILTTSTGAPVYSEDAESTLNKPLLSNAHVMKMMQSFVRERIPVRCVHTKGAGAFGYFQLTRDLSDICKAEFLNGVGKKTPVAARFSPSFAERGGIDLIRETRGFAVKWYTEEGNFDIPGFNTPIFAVKDASFLPELVHAARLNPVTDLKDANMFWDFITNRPETISIFLMLFSDEGIHDGYTNMPGHSIHTHLLYNALGKITFTRFYFYPVGGIKYLNSTEAARRGSLDPDYCARNLYNDIASGNFPTWDVLIQPMPEEILKNCTIDPMDITVEIPDHMFKKIHIGKLVLNRLPRNYFADVEQLAFCPGNHVPGIYGGLDKAYETRSMVYRDAQLYRLGSNFDNIKVNYPYRSKVNNYIRDGAPPVGDNGLDTPNYYPNSFNGPKPITDKYRPRIPTIHEKMANNWAEARNYYENRLVGNMRVGLVNNIIESLCLSVKMIQDKALDVFDKVHPDLGERVAEAMKKKKCRK